MKLNTRHQCQCCARKLTIIGVYDDGYLYMFDTETGVRWISTEDASIRFKKLEG